MRSLQKYFVCRGVLALLFAPGTLLATDTVLIHGHIYTGNPKAPWAQALAITGTKIDAVGTDQQILVLKQPTTQVIDLRGRTVIPGISDSHTHMWLGAMALHGFNLSTPESSTTQSDPDALVAKIRAYATSHPNEKFLFGRADFASAVPGTPTHEVVDLAVPDRPVIIHNTSEHALWLNSKALALAGITDQPVADPTEERNVIRDASGHPSGVLLESAMQILERAVFAKMPREEKLALLREASHYLNRYGVTSVVNATGNLAEIELYAALRDNGQLTVRTKNSFGAVAVNHHLTPEFLADLEQARSRYHDNWVSANLVKFFSDGGSGLFPPLTYTAPEFTNLVVELDKLGYQIMTHTLRGDTARMVLDAYEQLEKTNGQRDRRLRVEHADTVWPDDIPRFAKLSVLVSMQPTFCCGDNGANIDPQEKSVSDRWQSLQRSAAQLAFGSDWPCTWPPDPFVSIQETLTRQVWRAAAINGLPGAVLDGAGQGGAVGTSLVYAPEERISVEQAVRAYTLGSAYARFSEDKLGSLEIGKEADLAVLSQDIFSVPTETISKTKVELTMVAGRVVFQDSH